MPPSIKREVKENVNQLSMDNTILNFKTQSMKKVNYSSIIRRPENNIVENLLQKKKALPELVSHATRWIERRSLPCVKARQTAAWIRLHFSGFCTNVRFRLHSLGWLLAVLAKSAFWMTKTAIPSDDNFLQNIQYSTNKNSWATIESATKLCISSLPRLSGKLTLYLHCRMAQPAMELSPFHNFRAEQSDKTTQPELMKASIFQVTLLMCYIL